MIVKNEADIIEYTLRQAARWSDKIFILDNGSTDGTWEKLQHMKNEVITPWKQDDQVYCEHMRGWVFNRFRHLSRPGDWWCIKLDADEVYLDDPRVVLKQVPPKYHVVFHDSIEFRLTYEDLEEFTFSGNFAEDVRYLQYHLPATWAEIAFFRYRKRLIWPAQSEIPKHIGLFYPEKIRLKHYQYRSPEQIQLRLETRKKPKAINGHFRHLQSFNWQDYLLHRKDLRKIRADGQPDTIGCRNSHKHKPTARIVKRWLHGLGIWP